MSKETTVSSRLRRVASNSGWLLGSKGVNSLLGLSQELLIARTLGVGLYGRLGALVALVMVINQLMAFRLHEFVIKFLNDALAQGSNSRAAATIKFAVVTEAFTSVFAFGVTVVLAPLGARWILGSPDSTTLIVAYAAVILGNLVIETARGVLQAFGRFDRQSKIAVVGRTTALALVGLAVLVDGGIGSILFALAGGNLVTSGLLTFAALSETRERFGACWFSVPLTTLTDRRRHIVRFIFSTNLSSTLSLVTRDADLVWLGLLRGTVEVGYYKAATTIIKAAFLPIGALTRSSYPEISILASRAEYGDLRHLLKRLSLLVSTYLLPLGLVLFLMTDVLMSFSYGESFKPASLALRLLLVGEIASSAFFWSRPALLALNRPDIPLKINLLLASLKIPGVFLIVAAYGFIGNAALLSSLYLLGISLSVAKVLSETRRLEASVSA